MDWKGVWVNLLLLFQPMGAGPGQTDERFKKWIEARGMIPVAVTNIHQNAIENDKKIDELVALVAASIKV
jgi:hypothetical protein